MEQGRYRHLSFAEREQIAIWRLEGVSQVAMSRRLGRSSLTINRELARNRLPSGGYQPSFAAGSYLARRERAALLEQDERLERFVIDRLTEGWTPEQIAGPPWSPDHGCPELLPLYDEFSTLAGGGDHAARFLSFHCPPAYLAACSQAIWPGAEPVLVRNYDHSARAFDDLILHTRWQGRNVMGTSDGLWGLIHGLNDAGLAVSLTFGGR